MIDPPHFRDDAWMFPRWWPVVLSGVACAPACAAEQVEPDWSEGPAPAGGSSQGGAAGNATSSAGSSTLPQAGSLASSGTSSGAGTSGAGTSSGTAGSGHAGSTTGGAASGAAGSGSSGGSGGSGGSQPVRTGLPFTEDFEDGVANGFIPWNDKSTAGAWVVVADGAGKIYQPQAALSDFELAIGGSASWTDVAMTAKVRLNAAKTDARVVLRFKDAKNYLLIELAENKYKLRGRSNGSTEDLIAASPKPVIALGTWYIVGVTAKGSSVTLTLDGKAVGSPVTCDPAIASGGIGFGADVGSVSFDDISVTAAP